MRSAVSYLESQEEKEGLNRAVASIHEIPHEKVVGIRALSSDLEELHQIVELSVDVTADLHHEISLEEETISD